MEANCDSSVALIERFRALSADRQIPAEVWAVGSEIEAHPAFGIPELVLYRDSKRAFARHARRYYGDRRLVYRHIVPSAFTSPMGPGLMSGSFAARVALFLIRRGFRYVPVTYTGVAFFNYFKFLSLTPASPAACPRTGRSPTRHRGDKRHDAEGRAAKDGSSAHCPGCGGGLSLATWGFRLAGLSPLPVISNSSMGESRRCPSSFPTSPRSPMAVPRRATRWSSSITTRTRSSAARR